MARGGRRVGAGRKPKNLTAQVVRHPSSAPAPPAPPVVPTETFQAPEELDAESRKVWDRQAPFAFAHGTLTKASALAFARYCRTVVLEACESASTARGGANHRGLLKQVSSYEQQFLLAPCGKAMPLAAQPARDPEQAKDEDFFGVG